MSDTASLSAGCRNVNEAARSIPIIGDGDTGYGNALNVKRTVRGFASAGFAGILIEDQVLCVHTFCIIRIQLSIRSIEKHSQRCNALRQDSPAMAHAGFVRCMIRISTRW